MKLNELFDYLSTFNTIKVYDSGCILDAKSGMLTQYDGKNGIDEQFNDWNVDLIKAHSREAGTLCIFISNN